MAKRSARDVRGRRFESNPGQNLLLFCLVLLYTFIVSNYYIFASGPVPGGTPTAVDGRRSSDHFEMLLFQVVSPTVKHTIGYKSLPFLMVIDVKGLECAAFDRMALASPTEDILIKPIL